MLRHMAECTVPGCTVAHPADSPFCGMHWRSLPRYLSDRIWAAERTHGVLSTDYADAVAAALAYFALPWYAR